MSNRNAELAARRAYEVSGYTLYTDRPDIGLQVYTTPAGAGGLLAKCFLGKAGKPAWFYRFRTDAELDTMVERQVKGCTASAAYKASRKADAAAPVEVAVGDVFRAMWGYDQTNVDYYQVTRVIGPKTVEIRKIAATSWDTEYLQGRSVPATDEFIGKPMVKRVKNVGSGRAAVKIYSFADAYRMDPVIPGTPLYESAAWTAYA